MIAAANKLSVVVKNVVGRAPAPPSPTRSEVEFTVSPSARPLTPVMPDSAAVARQPSGLQRQASPPPTSVATPSSLDTSWVCEVWLSELGLSQYADVFRQRRVSGALLELIAPDTLALFGITNSVHVRSILAGVRLLKQCGFDCNIVRNLRDRTDVRTFAVASPACCLYFTHPSTICRPLRDTL